MVQDSDVRDLLQQIAVGNEAAMNRFFHSHHRLVYAFALRRLNDPADAAEVLNDVMLQVWRSADRFAGNSKVSTWLLGIANHKILDLYRRRSRASFEELDESLEDDNVLAVESGIALAEDAELVKRCLEKLSAAHREVMYLTFYEDMSYPEIAKSLSCPTGTVKTRMLHAKKNLQRCLSALRPGTD